MAFLIPEEVWFASHRCRPWIVAILTARLADRTCLLELLLARPFERSATRFLRSCEKMSPRSRRARREKKKLLYLQHLFSAISAPRR